MSRKGRSSCERLLRDDGRVNTTVSTRRLPAPFGACLVPRYSTSITQSQSGEETFGFQGLAAPPRAFGYGNDWTPFSTGAGSLWSHALDAKSSLARPSAPRWLGSSCPFGGGHFAWLRTSADRQFGRKRERSESGHGNRFVSIRVSAAPLLSLVAPQWRCDSDSSWLTETDPHPLCALPKPALCPLRISLAAGCMRQGKATC